MNLLIKKILALVFSIFLFLLIFSGKANAACSNPVWTNGTQASGLTSITYNLTLKSNCSTTANFTLTASRPSSSWTYQYSGCSINTACVKSIGAFKTINVSLTITRPLGQAPGSYTITAKAQQSSTVFKTISLIYKVIAEKYNCSSSHQCVAAATGTYSSLSTCQTNCWLYKCDTTNYTCAKSATGTLTSCSTCVAPIPSCTYTYSAWSTCSSGGTQTRTVISSSPSGCTGTPITSRSCTVPSCTYTYSAWSTCSSGGTQTRTVISSFPSGCTGTPNLSQSCTPPLCPRGALSAFAPSGVPTGGLCRLNQIIGTFLNILMIIAILLATLYLILGGISWITSGGDKQKLVSAKHRLTFAIIGLVVVFASFMILNFLKKFFGIS